MTQTIGFIGLGAMGRPMVENLLRAGKAVRVFDLDSERVAACARQGAAAAKNAAEIAQQCEVVCTSLPSSESWVKVAENELLPQARSRQIFIDFGTVTPPETRRIAALFTNKGAAMLDVPVSGGEAGAQKAALLMFAGGDRESFERVRSLLEIIGGSERLHYCGPAGAGQAVKGTNQLAMGLYAAAALEAIAFATREGVAIETAVAAVGDGSEPWRQHLRGVGNRVVQGEGENTGVKFRELPYYIRAAQEIGFTLPLTEALWEFCDRGERVTIDDNRPAPSFWRELTKDE